MEGFRRQAGCDRNLESIKGCAAKNVSSCNLPLSVYSVLWIFFFLKLYISTVRQKRPMCVCVCDFFFFRFAGMTLAKWRLQLFTASGCQCGGIPFFQQKIKKKNQPKNSRLIIFYSFFFYSHAITCSFWHDHHKNMLFFSLSWLYAVTWNNMYSYISFWNFWIHNVVYEIFRL